MESIEAEFARLCARQDALHRTAEEHVAAIADLLRHHLHTLASASTVAPPPPPPSGQQAIADEKSAEHPEQHPVSQDARNVLEGDEKDDHHHHHRGDTAPPLPEQQHIALHPSATSDSPDQWPKDSNQDHQHRDVDPETEQTGRNISHAPGDDHQTNKNTNEKDIKDICLTTISSIEPNTQEGNRDAIDPPAPTSMALSHHDVHPTDGSPASNKNPDPSWSAIWSLLASLPSAQTIRAIPSPAASQSEQHKDPPSEDHLRTTPSTSLSPFSAQRSTPRRRPRPHHPSEEPGSQPEEQRLRRDVPEQQQEPQLHPVSHAPSDIPPRTDVMEGVELLSRTSLQNSHLATESPAAADTSARGNEEIAAISPGERAQVDTAPNEEIATAAESTGGASATDVLPRARIDALIDTAGGSVSVWEGSIGATTLDLVMSDAVEQHLDIATSAAQSAETRRELNHLHASLHEISTNPSLPSGLGVSPLQEQGHDVRDQACAGGIATALNAPTSTPLRIVDAMKAASKELQNSLASDWKEVGSSHVRLSKAIDDVAGGDLSSVVASSLKLDRGLVNKAVAGHLYRSGYFEVAELFSQRASIDVQAEKVQPYETLNCLLSALRASDRRPAILWAVENRSKLLRDSEDRSDSHSPVLTVSSSDGENVGQDVGQDLGQEESSSPVQSQENGEEREYSSGSLLEFSLHRQDYLDLLVNGKRNEALEYARRYFASFIEDFLDDIQELMACLLFAPEVAASPYGHLVLPSRREELEQMLSSEYCRVMNVTVESPLLSVTRCGAKALPVLRRGAMISPNLKELGEHDVLPVEVELGREYQYHTVFVCPVSREETMDSDNKSMMLPCGHVLSRQSIVRLPRGSQRFKCPYCPREQVQADCVVVHF